MGDWLGEEWEAWCLALVRQHYGADQVQEIPARDGGDLGIEAFTYCGNAFQCYAPQDCFDVQDLYEKQRNKLSTDLGKLRKKEQSLAKLLGRVRIKRYMFMVPRHDSFRIVQHASAKSLEYRDLKLSILDDEFEIVVVTDDAFSLERSKIISRTRPLVSVSVSNHDEVKTWMGANGALVAVADSKLAKILTDAAQRNQYVSALIGRHVEVQNLMQGLRERYPDQWEDIQRCVNEKESFLILEYPMGIAAQPDTSTLTQIAKDLQVELSNNVPSLDAGNVRRLSWSAVVEWLMRCPLDFYEEVSIA